MKKLIMREGFDDFDLLKAETNSVAFGSFGNLPVEILPAPSATEQRYMWRKDLPWKLLLFR